VSELDPLVEAVRLFTAVQDAQPRSVTCGISELIMGGKIDLDLRSVSSALEGGTSDIYIDTVNIERKPLGRRTDRESGPCGILALDLCERGKCRERRLRSVSQSTVCKDKC
jgi:hypothetical protein